MSQNWYLECNIEYLVVLIVENNLSSTLEAFFYFVPI